MIQFPIALIYYSLINGDFSPRTCNSIKYIRLENMTILMVKKVSKRMIS